MHASGMGPASACALGMFPNWTKNCSSYSYRESDVIGTLKHCLSLVAEVAKVTV